MNDVVKSHACKIAKHYRIANCSFLYSEMEAACAEAVLDFKEAIKPARAESKNLLALEIEPSGLLNLSSAVQNLTIDDYKEIQRKYNELVFAVGNKYPGETRHETALRYITQAETPANNTASQAKQIG